MENDAALTIMYYFSNVDILMLILVRVLGFFVIMPVISANSIPVSIKISLSLLIAVFIYSTGVITDVNYQETAFGYFNAIFKEFLVGFILGVVVYIVFTIFLFAGQLIDYQIGLTRATTMNPLTGTQDPATGTIMLLFVALIFVRIGGFNTILYTFIYSFEQIPIGEAFLIGNKGIANYVIDTIIISFEMGARISMPIMGAILILDVALGILAKAAPQMHIFSVGMPLKLIFGLALFSVIVPIISQLYDYTFNESYKNILNMIDGMTP